jgi:hypothetical protein
MKTEIVSTVIYNLLNMPIHKLKYAVRSNLIEGAFLTLPHYYNIELTEEIFQIFYDILNEKLSGSSDIEYEFETEEEYNNVMNLKKLIKEKYNEK